jgi:hypothetical protein
LLCENRRTVGRISEDGLIAAQRQGPIAKTHTQPPQADRISSAHGKPALVDRQNPVLATGPVCRRRVPGRSRKNAVPPGDRGFKSISLQRRVCNEPCRRGRPRAAGEHPPRPILAAARFSILRNPLAVIGAPRSVMKTCRPDCSFCTRRKALISTPESGWKNGTPLELCQFGKKERSRTRMMSSGCINDKTSALLSSPFRVIITKF